MFRSCFRGFLGLFVSLLCRFLFLCGSLGRCFLFFFSGLFCGCFRGFLGLFVSLLRRCLFLCGGLGRGFLFLFCSLLGIFGGLIRRLFLLFRQFLRFLFLFLVYFLALLGDVGILRIGRGGLIELLGGFVILLFVNKSARLFYKLLCFLALLLGGRLGSLFCFFFRCLGGFSSLCLLPGILCLFRFSSGLFSSVSRLFRFVGRIILLFCYVFFLAQNLRAFRINFLSRRHLAQCARIVALFGQVVGVFQNLRDLILLNFCFQFARLGILRIQSLGLLDFLKSLGILLLISKFAGLF